MKFTTWLKLKKPELTDVADIDVLNENFDKIDEEVNNKVDKIEGKGLSTEDYTSLEKEKLSKIADGAQVNTVTGVKGDNESSYRTGNINITKANVGLGSVPNVPTNNQTPTYTEASSLTALVSGETLATAFGKIKKAISDFISHKGSTSNPHSVTKSQVGLGDVPNVTTNNQTPTYTQASSLTALVSGETLATAFGKIAKAIANLISHINKTSDSSSASALSSSDTNYPTVRDVYYGLPNINGSHSYTSSTNIYGPTSSGTAGYELVSNGSGAPVWKAPSYAVCTTEGATSAKTVSISNFKLIKGARVLIKFENEHTSFANVATLNVNNTGAKPIKYYGRDVRGRNLPANSNYYYNAPINTWDAGEVVEFVYDGTYWVSTISKNLDPRYITLGNGVYYPGTNSATTFSLSYINAKFSDFISFPAWLFGSNSSTVFDSTDIIQNAIDALANNGTLKLSPGLFAIKNEVNLGYKNITIEGSKPVGNYEAGFAFFETGKLAFPSNYSGGTLTLRNLSIDAENLACIIKTNDGRVILDNVYINVHNNNGTSDMGGFSLIISEKLKMINCLYKVYCQTLHNDPCWSGIDCTLLQVDNSTIILENHDSSTSADLNFIYNTNVKGYIRDSTIELSGCSNLTNGQITVDNCDITLGSSSSICHYTDSTEMKYSILRDSIITYSNTTYLTFGKIIGCTFKNTTNTNYSKDNGKLQILGYAQIVANKFIGRSEMNFNNYKVLFADNVLQYSQSYTNFPSGSINVNNMISV